MSVPTDAAGATKSVPFLTLEGVASGYLQSDVLSDLSMTIYRGEIVSLLGSNGAGKTTTIRTISGELKPRRGKIVFAGTDIGRAAPQEILRLGVATVPEGRGVFPGLSVEENLRMGAYVHRRRYRPESLDRIYGIFPRLHQRKTQLAGTLSGGEQQMLAIGRAMMAEPQLLLLDEPSMGLAPIIVDLVFDTIRYLASTGMTILLVEQNAATALEISERAYVLERGRIGCSGTAREVADDPTVRSAYLGHV